MSDSIRQSARLVIEAAVATDEIDFVAELEFSVPAHGHRRAARHRGLGSRGLPAVVETLPSSHPIFQPKRR